MQTKKDISYGIIPIKKIEGAWKVFLINQFSKIGNNTYWVLPKGHPEAGESPLQTAVRELKEETNMHATQVFQEPVFTSEYSFVYDGAKIEKSVHFFIGIIEAAEVMLDPQEVKEAGWYGLEAAIERLDYKQTKELFRAAKLHIEQKL
ncbi:NUDIX domain-containing protein [Candidatus Kaiserbacteria bacterium]|nr:NUDIX domain-containing protein [Candidatus Kaiserbacteria bacterium]USN89084.1 MAG: NUDIX domain-containing protein [Candidatus Nomurabacteria bacterium]